MLSRCILDFSVCVGAFVIGLSQIFSFYSYEETHFMKEHFDSKKKYYKDDTIKMLEFLVDKMFVVFARRVYK